MAIPRQRDILLPLLHLVYSQGGRILPEDAVNILGGYFKLSYEEMLVTYQNSNERIFRNTVHWARNKLCDWGLLSREVRGVWIITEKGEKTLVDLGLNSRSFPYPQGYSELNEKLFEMNSRPLLSFIIDWDDILEKENSDLSTSEIPYEREEAIIKSVIEKIKSDRKLKKFPEDFIKQDITNGFHEVKLPGTPLKFHSLSSNVIVSDVGFFRYEAKNKAEAKFIIYAHDIGLPYVKIPSEPLVIVSANSEYENYCKEIKNEVFKTLLDLVDYNESEAERLTKRVMEKMRLKFIP